MQAQVYIYATNFSSYREYDRTDEYISFTYIRNGAQVKGDNCKVVRNVIVQGRKSNLSWILLVLKNDKNVQICRPVEPNIFITEL